MKKLVSSKKQITQAFARWWADYEADPAAFTNGPDLKGRDSAQVFIEYAQKFGASYERTAGK